MKQLKDQSFLTMGGNIEASIINACADAGFTPNIVARINDIVCYRKMMLSGIGIGYRRDQGNNPIEGLCYLDVTDFKLIQRMCVYYKKDIDGPVRNFLEFLRTKCE